MSCRADSGRAPAPATAPLVIVVGPTAAGKTELAVGLASRLGGEVVGADAFQVYRHMDVGTAKPSAEQRAAVAHHLLDVAEPDEPFDAHRYVELADRAIAAIRARSRVPVVAGGTGLYVRSLVRGLAEMPGRDPELRLRLEAEARRLGPGTLHRRLAAVDPRYAARVGERDVVRIVRALEVHEVSGRTISEVHDEHAARPDRHAALWTGLDPGREALRARIERRTEAIFAGGLVDEARRLREMGYGPALPSMRALGYGPAFELLDGTIDEAEARRRTVLDTARYARRQRSWFRSEPAVEWTEGELEAVVERTASRLAGFGQVVVRRAEGARGLPPLSSR